MKFIQIQKKLLALCFLLACQMGHVLEATNASEELPILISSAPSGAYTGPNKDWYGRVPFSPESDEEIKKSIALMHQVDGMENCRQSLQHIELQRNLAGLDKQILDKDEVLNGCTTKDYHKWLSKSTEGAESEFVDYHKDRDFGDWLNENFSFKEYLYDTILSCWARNLIGNALQRRGDRYTLLLEFWARKAKLKLIFPKELHQMVLAYALPDDHLPLFRRHDKLLAQIKELAIPRNLKLKKEMEGLYELLQAEQHSDSVIIEYLTSTYTKGVGWSRIKAPEPDCGIYEIIGSLVGTTIGLAVPYHTGLVTSTSDPEGGNLVLGWTSGIGAILGAYIGCRVSRWRNQLQYTYQDPSKKDL